ncbi:SMP-30/gluconolactonase/LRE family protein [Pseudomonas lini]|uniref:Lactonase n=1 Tax=Pseudomonas lini TaxID=163011 RepID=A0A0J6HLD8_9PSED|nr:SMP-30/gluconolactonase/LRE family protein [Pseudomonas lini]KAB0495995.1 SMP-30/gluconolactonase/LRE family protein [Pseudomonas lini]KMM95154.1 lactonase [Pseudomonas lini]SDT29116.1 lactonase [Pseudomonas lini]
MQKSTLVALAIALTSRLSLADNSDTLPTLNYPTQGQQLYATAAAEKDLLTITAQPWFKVTGEAWQLEGPAFDRQGNLLFVEVLGGQVLKVDTQGQLQVAVAKNARGSAGLAIHKDGRLFVAGLGNYVDTGNLTVYDANGKKPEVIIDANKGFLVDDLVFDAHGGFYFTDLKGTSTEPTGGVYYVPADHKSIVPILPNMANANGIALSPDGKRLWVTEFGTGLLHRVELKDAQSIAPFGAVVVYRFHGPSPDSMRVDADGNVYVAQYSQGRVLVLNPNGLPIGQILLPGREAGHFLFSTSMALKPGTREVYLVANDGDRGQGSMIFRARGFAQALPLFSHQ